VYINPFRSTILISMKLGYVVEEKYPLWNLIQ